LEAPLTKKLPFLHDPDDGFFAVLGRDDELYATLLNEQDRVRDFTLEKDILIVPVVLGGSTGASLCEQLVGIVLVGPKCRLSFSHGASLEAGAQHSQSPY
jgi:hypothetical protein